VFVNGEAETRRKRQLVLGDTVQFEDQQFDVSAEDDA
jgi:ribosome-associated protein YbcJ (S4-like RNA binding protein)